MRGKAKFLAVVWLAVVAVWAVCACMGWGGQRKLFFEEGRQELYDFWMPRMCLEQGYADGPEFSDWRMTPDGPRFITGTLDKVYPAFALLPFRLFPASREGGWCWSALAGLFYLGALVLVARRRSPAAACWPVIFVGSMPFLYNLERGNPVWLSAALCGLFLAWWDDDKPIRRMGAAVCLGIAAVLKIAPAALGLLYVGKIVRTWCKEGARSVWQASFQMPVLAAVVVLVLFIVPWPFVPGGLGSISVMIHNAAHHADFVLRSADFGLIPIWRAVRVVLHQDVSGVWPGMLLVARLSQVLGLLALLMGAWRRRYLLLVGGMLLAAGNMYYYAALYLIPVFVLEGVDCRRLGRLALWFAILCPIQLVLLGHSGNIVLCNMSLLALMFLDTRCPK